MIRIAYDPAALCSLADYGFEDLSGGPVDLINSYVLVRRDMGIAVDRWGCAFHVTIFPLLTVIKEWYGEQRCFMGDTPAKAIATAIQACPILSLDHVLVAAWGGE